MDQAVVDLLRRLIAEPDDAAPYTTAELTALLEAKPCIDQVTRVPKTDEWDTYAVAADVWDLKALDAEVTATDADRKITSERNRDQAVTYADRGGKLDAAGMRALAARLRRRSCNGGRSKSVRVAPPEPHGAEVLDDFGGVEFEPPHPADTTARYVVNGPYGDVDA